MVLGAEAVKCRTCADRRLRHAEWCPRYLACGTCDCEPLLCWTCVERRGRRRTWALVALGIAIALALLAIML